MTIVTTPDKKAVVLRDDGTWTYAAAAGSVLGRWRSLAVPDAVVKMLEGVFDRIGVKIIETAETITCQHRGDRIEITPGLDPSHVDFVIEIHAFQAERLAAQIASGEIDDLERFRIAREVFVAAGRTNVGNPLLSSPNLRRIIRAKNLVHINLVSPDAAQEPDAHYSLIHVNKTSLLVPGHHGTPERVFRLTVPDVLELQQVFGPALKRNRAREWLKIAKWYLEWRKRVEVPA
jgi:hypothetical protein